MPMAAPEATAGGFIKRAISPCLAAGNERRRAGEIRSRSPGPLHATVCAPPGATTVSGEMQRRNASTAVAAAEVPVPEEVVGPTPRSKMRISISRSLTMRTNSTLVWCGKSGCTQISAPMVCQGLPPTAKSGLSTTMTKCGLPVETSTPTISEPSVSLSVCGVKLGTPMPVVTSTVNAPSRSHAVDAADAQAGIGRNFQLVARLRAERLGHPRGHAAGAVAADLGDRAVGVVEADAAGSWRRSRQRTRCRRRRCRYCARKDAASGRRDRGLPAASSVTIRKSLPQAWALVKGINLPPDRGRRRARRWLLQSASSKWFFRLLRARAGSLPDAITAHGWLLRPWRGPSGRANC